jgi:glycosyltransferase involved in cell wall biosynthesis
MRILFVISALDLGGAAAQVALLSKELVRRGHAASVYSLGRSTERLPEFVGSGVDVIVDDKAGRIDFAVLWRLRRHIQRWRPDIVHGFGCDADVYCRLASAGAAAAVLNSERTDSEQLSRAQHLGYRITSLLCDGIVANTHGGARFARRVHRVAEDRVDVLWNAIDLEAVDRRIARSTQPAREIFPGMHLKRIAMVASIKPVNDHPLALRALKKLIDKDASWRLICVGEAPAQLHGYKAQVRAECQDLGIAPFVRFVGHRSDVVELVASSDVLLFTSTQGGFPLAALEAMACNTAVVSTDWGDVRRLLPDARQVVGSRTEADTAAAVADCYRRRDHIVSAQRRWAEHHGTASAAAAKLLEIYVKYLPDSLRREIAAHS